MKPIQKIRQLNFASVIAQKCDGSQTIAANRLGYSTPSLVNRYLSGSKDIGNGTARKIETEFGYPEFWMDADHEVPLPPGYTRIIEHDPDNEEFVEIRKVKLKLSAGITGFESAPDMDDGRPITFRKEWLIKKGYVAEKLVAIGVKGESMEPTMSAGDTVVINIADTIPKDGKTYAVNLDGEAVIKRMARNYGRWFLMSDNPDQARYHPHECTQGNCIVIGRVVMLQREDF